MKKIFCPLALLLALSSLSGCGLKGPLYFPPADGKTKPTSQVTPDKQTQSTAPERNDRGTDNAPTQVIY
ncbi:MULTISPECIES: LPS translocon maturation chaperone LptM [Buttiauxella]|jgi:predicted small lipoprotein YifL|uniref:LPS-assembly lipoprotein LptM n=2 Tax=Buttiauxella agrestis TaxID=82977 RepID=A0A085GMK1_9ENTR|nr:MULTISPECIES: lipoprotein [Buttiauxella]KFC84946.1 putative lipoprotein [Buttiauxella agrestis ATCC 33320]MCS3604856.1 putative small lipoprotein YifL [Buttiauxella sp. BIGb0471]BCG11280.1 membrane protein [Buttiauxella agrestis]SUW65913.1 Predicted small periplasmic lipoprotein [Buttiauxella agrestis]